MPPSGISDWAASPGPLVRRIRVPYSTRQALEPLRDHDRLTGSRNRHGLFRALGKRLHSLAGRNFLAYMDLNEFTQINDTYGHEAGDKVVCAFEAAETRHVDRATFLPAWAGTNSCHLPAGHGKGRGGQDASGIRQACAEPLELCPGERGRIESACGPAFWRKGRTISRPCSGRSLPPCTAIKTLSEGTP